MKVIASKSVCFSLISSSYVYTTNSSGYGEREMILMQKWLYRGGGNDKSQRRKSRCRHFEPASHHLIRIFFSLDRSHEVVTLTVSPSLSHRTSSTLNDLGLRDSLWHVQNYAVQNGGSRPIRRWRDHAVDLVLGMSAPRPLSSLGDLYSWLSRGRRGPVTPRGSPSTSTSRPGRQQPPGAPLCGKSDVLSCRAPFPLPA